MNSKRLLLIAALAVAAGTIPMTTPPIYGQQPSYRTPSRPIAFREGTEIITLDSLFGPRAVIGVRAVDITPELREQYGAPKDAGILVGSVEDGGPADKAGVKVGDVIVSVDGDDVDSSGDLRQALRDKKNGDSVRLDVVRGRKHQTLVANVNVREREVPGRATVIAPPELQRRLDTIFDGTDWHARIVNVPNCDDLQTRIRDLESRLKDLERKLQK